jgi:hypothetical protein
MSDKTEQYSFLDPLNRGPRGKTSEQVERSLRSAIVALEFAPGEFIDKGLVCARLGVSRFPVSEALARLAVEGLVEIIPQRGTRAARIRLAEIKEAMLIRKALEAVVAETAARRLPSPALTALKKIFMHRRRLSRRVTALASMLSISPSMPFWQTAWRCRGSQPRSRPRAQISIGSDAFSPPHLGTPSRWPSTETCSKRWTVTMHRLHGARWKLIWKL